jgi:hypothetical protein
MSYVWSDGGRAEAGYKGATGDCGARALAIAMEIPYKRAYKILAGAAKIAGRPKSARNGISCETMDAVMAGLGWTYFPVPRQEGGEATAKCLPPGRLVTYMTNHYAAVVDQVVHDVGDCSQREVHGFWRKR